MALLKQNLFWRLITGRCKVILKPRIVPNTVLVILFSNKSLFLVIKPDKAEPCEQPKTIDSSLDSCDAKMARNLKAESHMIGWLIVTVTFFLATIAIVVKMSLSRFSYFQNMWIAAYRKVQNF